MDLAAFREGSEMYRTAFIACAAALLSPHAFAQDSGLGAREYVIACAGCHGDSGKGDGPIAGLLEIETPDLTRLAEHAGGTFPYEATLSMIDGRNDIRAHGSQMPVWGDRFFVSAATSDGPDPVQAELMAKGRMIALVGYLRSIQGE
jgi:mono/diheme cytochrome c family protein